MIKNKKELAVSKTRKAAIKIIEKGFEAIDTKAVIKNNIKISRGFLIVAGEKFDLDKLGKVLVIGVGKCSLEAASAAEKILGKRLLGGIVIDVHNGSAHSTSSGQAGSPQGGKLKKIKTFTGTHPFPSQANINATKQIINLLSGLKEKDLVIFLISGGGSTLLCQPNNMTYQDETEVMRRLFDSGADIKEINTIRKHISFARGGYLTKYAFPAKSVSLIFSDVPGNNLEFISSGPTVKDTTTISDAKKIIEKYGISKQCGFLENDLIETPKEEKYFKSVKNILVVTNDIALEAMAKEAKKLGYLSKIITDKLSGEAKDVGIKIAKEVNSAKPKAILLYGGETTVSVKGEAGKGGRNQELGLSAIRFIKHGIFLASIASDGRDNSDRAGVFCDIITKEKAKKLGLDPEKYLKRHDSYQFFSKVGEYIITGDTGLNVSDLIIAIHE